jgi:hypothetical protein
LGLPANDGCFFRKSLSGSPQHVPQGLASGNGVDGAGKGSQDGHAGILGQKKATQRWLEIEAKNYFFSASVAGAVAGAAGAGAAGASAAGAGAAAGAGGVSFLPQATKAAANKVAKRSDFFMGVP